MTFDFQWTDALALDVRFGYLRGDVLAPRQRHPKVVLNNAAGSVLRSLREELSRSTAFTFSVAFVSSRAIALLKQELLDFEGPARIITSDYLAFNSPQAFAELLNLRPIGVDVRIHSSSAFHPKGYIFEHPDGVTAMVGSANLTENALVRNHEWNLMVSAAADSDLAEQLRTLVRRELEESVSLTQEWIDEYAAGYVAPAPRVRPTHHDSALSGTAASIRIVPNRMQRDALEAIAAGRLDGHKKAIIISATGTGKTILSALDVRQVDPRRLLFLVHREQILDRTISEYRRVLGGAGVDYGKLTGTVKQASRRYMFATVQTISRPEILSSIRPDEFDYVIIDEAHRAGAPSYRRILNHLRPEFMLGMTATPERTDGFNVFELFDYNVPYEIRLNHALEEDMLCPFHYYGVEEVTYADGTTVTDDTELSVLISPERVDHLVEAIETYGQAGVPPRGLIFCARVKEAEALAAALNERQHRGRDLRTVALSGTDTVAHREAVVAELERGELDYILTVDVFNEGVDIPTVNQIVMLRQTQSAIVFVQQLGRGLRKADGKEYLVVIDFIGAYANNFMIPIALFGDESLNKESLRKNMIAAEEQGVLPGLSSVRFDKVSQDRVLQAIASTKLDAMQRLRAAVVAMRNRVGGIPALEDFLRFESVDPVLLATTRENYPALIDAILREDSGLSPDESRALSLLSHEVLTAKRLHEFVLLDTLLKSGTLSHAEVAEVFSAHELPATAPHVKGAIDTFTLEHHSEADQKRYLRGIIERRPDGNLWFSSQFTSAYETNPALRRAVDDLLTTGMQIVSDRYSRSAPFTSGMQYSRKEVCRLLNWPRKWTSTLYGYRTDVLTGMCPIFVTLHKSDEISASTAYQDALLDRTTMRWYTRSRRTLASAEVAAIVANEVEIHVFVKKDDAEGSDFYYLGQATAHDAEQTTMPGADGKALDVARMLLRFEAPIDLAMYDYFHPVVTS